MTVTPAAPAPAAQTAADFTPEQLELQERARRFVEAATVHEKDIQPAFVIVAQQGDAATHRFDEVFLGCRAAVAAKPDAGLIRDIGEYGQSGSRFRMGKPVAP